MISEDYQRIHQHVDFVLKPPCFSRSPGLYGFFGPALCWMRAHNGTVDHRYSGPPHAQQGKDAAHTPLLAPAAPSAVVLFNHEALGRSRQGYRCGNGVSTGSTNRRLFAAVTPDEARSSGTHS